MSKSFTVEEVAKHNTANDCWIIVEGQVYDVTKFLKEHPGGSKVILKLAGPIFNYSLPCLLLNRKGCY